MECIVPWQQPMMTIFSQPLRVNCYLPLNVVIPAFRSSLLVLRLHILIYGLMRWLFFSKSPDVKINVRTPTIHETLNRPSIFSKAVMGSVCYYHVCIIISRYITIHAIPQFRDFLSSVFHNFENIEMRKKNLPQPNIQTNVQPIFIRVFTGQRSLCITFLQVPRFADKRT